MFSSASSVVRALRTPGRGDGVSPRSGDENWDGTD